MTNAAGKITTQTVEIYWPEGGSPCTGRVALSNAETHITARDPLAEESRVLLARRQGERPEGWEMVAEGEDADGEWCEVWARDD